jgi:uncharacterized membrane protein
METLGSVGILSLPLVFNLLALARYHGPYRRAAVLVLPIIVAVWMFELYSQSLKGNLTGLISMVVALPLMVVLLLLGVGDLLSRARGSSIRSDREKISRRSGPTPG